MVLKNHVAYRILASDEIALRMVENFYPADFRAWKSLKDDRGFYKIQTMYTLLNTSYNKTYVVTNTVFDKLPLLKIKNINWNVFENISERKITLILPNQTFVRAYFRYDKVEVCYAQAKPAKESVPGEHKEGDLYLKYTVFFVDLKTGEEKLPSDKTLDESDKMLVYKLFCFMFLTENQEEIIDAGKTYGTRKSGKILNDFNFPVTVVNSKWNITTINNQGFNVSGHFRLQWYGEGRSKWQMIFIEPFKKNGYKRTAGKLLNS